MDAIEIVEFCGKIDEIFEIVISKAIEYRQKSVIPLSFERHIPTELIYK